MHRCFYRLSLITPLLLLATVSQANMRCGDDIVQRGYTFFEVLERCGKPDLEYAWDHRYVPGVEARVTEWVYEQGTNKFRRVLRFEEGRLRRVELRPKPEVPLDSLNGN
ncbi:MAG: DUF2845 domain-containing protein [Pseudomonadota bacterium]